MYFEVYIYAYITKLLLLCASPITTYMQFVMVDSLGADWFERLTGAYALQSTCRSHLWRVEQVAKLLQQFCIASNKQQRQPAASTTAATVSASATDATATTAVTWTTDAAEQRTHAQTVSVTSSRSTDLSNSPAIDARMATLPQSVKDIVKVTSFTHTRLAVMYMLLAVWPLTLC
jgi:hypothetical protein